MTDTTQMLREIPDLAADVEATRYHPNPGDRSEKTRKPAAGSKPPMSLAMLHATMPDGDAAYAGRGLRGTLAMCVRLVIEEWADTSTSDIPDFPDDTWWSICEWLAGTEATWRAMPWADDIDSDIRQVHGQLRMLARAPRELVFECPRCGDDMRLQEGGEYLLCDSGHQETANQERKYRRAPAKPEAEVAEEFGIRVGRLRVWRTRKQLKPAYVSGGIPYYFPWDVLLLARPIIADALEEREGAA